MLTVALAPSFPRLPDTTQLVVVLITAYLLACAWTLVTHRYRVRRPHELPGPPRLPLLGSAPWLLDRRRSLLEVLEGMADTYGSIFRVNIRGKECVFLGEDDIVTEVFARHAASLGGERSPAIVDRAAGLKDFYVTSCPTSHPHTVNLRRLASGVIRNNDDLTVSTVRGVMQELQSQEQPGDDTTPNVITSSDLADKFGHVLCAGLAFGLKDRSPHEIMTTPEIAGLHSFVDVLFPLVTFGSKSLVLPFEVMCLLRPWEAMGVVWTAKWMRMRLDRIWIGLERFLDAAHRDHVFSPSQAQGGSSRHMETGTPINAGTESKPLWPRSIYGQVLARPKLAESTATRVVHAQTVFIAASLAIHICLRCLFACVAYDQRLQAELYAQIQALEARFGGGGGGGDDADSEDKDTATTTPTNGGAKAKDLGGVSIVPPLARAIVLETLRVWPERPISHNFEVLQDLVVRGYHVRKGSVLAVLISRANSVFTPRRPEGRDEHGDGDDDDDDDDTTAQSRHHPNWDPEAALHEAGFDSREIFDEKRRPASDAELAQKIASVATFNNYPRPRWTFGFGKRQCPATSYATQVVAQYLCAVVKRYRIDFALPIDRETQSMEDVLDTRWDGATLLAFPPALKLERRL